MRTLLTFVALVVIGFSIYSVGLDGAFQFDDQTSILENEALRSARPAAWWNYWPTRGLTYISLGLNFQASGLNPHGYHLTNLAIHLLATLAVWWFLGEVLRDERRATGLAWAGALLFLVHPLQTQGVVYVVQRAVSLMTLFTVTSVAASLAARRHAVDGGRTWPRWVASYVSAGLAMVSKEPAVILPLLMVTSHACAGLGPTPRRQLAAFFLLPLLPLGLASAGNFGADAPTLTAQTSEVSRGSYLLTQIEVVARYLRLVVVPIGQNLDHHIPWRTTLADPTLLAFLLVHLALWTTAGIAFRRGHRRAALAIAWFYLALVPESSLFPIEDAMVEHRAMPAMVGPALGVALVGTAWRPRPRWLVAGLGLVVLTLLGGLTVERCRLWRDPMLLWSDALAKSPDKARPHMAVGWLHSTAERWEPARVELTRAVEIDPDYGMAWNNLGIVGTRTEDYELAARAYAHATRLHPDEPVPWSNLGGAELRRRRFPAASRALERAIHLNPDQGSLHNDLALAYALQERWDEARASIQRAQELGAAQQWVRELIDARALPGAAN